MRGDSLVKIAARYGISTKVLAMQNGLDLHARLAVGQRLKVELKRLLPGAAVPDGIVVNVPQRMVYLFRAGEPIHRFPAAVGRPDWPTPTGEFVVIIGESGSGKTTLVKALAGVTDPTGGQVLVSGEPVQGRLTDIGYVPQDEIVHRGLTVVEGLRYAAWLRLPKDSTAAEYTTVSPVPRS